MRKLKEIRINPFQLNRLLSKKRMNDYRFLLAKGVFCSSCGGVCTEGIHVNEIILNSMNDILVRGSCKVCQGKVARVMEFGEDETFYEQANAFRATLEE